MRLMAIDPGRDKCGYAVLSDSEGVLEQRVIATASLEEELKTSYQQFGWAQIVMGNGTTSSQAKARMEAVLLKLGIAVPIEVVDEYKTTELARAEYFKAHPPQGLKRLLPVSMQTPPCPVDDFVAVILGRRYLGQDK